MMILRVFAFFKKTMWLININLNSKNVKQQQIYKKKHLAETVNLPIPGLFAIQK